MKKVLFLLPLLVAGCGVYEAPLAIRGTIYGGEGVIIDGGHRVVDLKGAKVRSGRGITLKSQDNVVNADDVRAPGKSIIKLY